MNNRNFLGTVILLLSIFFVSDVFSQELSKFDESIFERATDMFMDGDFLGARPLYEELVEKNPDHFETNYYLGACYLNTRYNKAKAIPYLENAVKIGEDVIPSVVHKDLGDLYHLTYDFDKAIYHYESYAIKASKRDEFKAHARRMVKTCINAKLLVLDTLDVSIENLGSVVNTDDSEFAPCISADDSVLFFTSKKFYTDEELMQVSYPDTISHLYMSIKKDGDWAAPIKIDVQGIDIDKGVSLAGLSPDGEYVYVNAERDGQQDIFVARYVSQGELSFEPMPTPINSDSYEGKVTMSADGNTFYFSSDRSGGFGGKDIYKSVRNADSTWSAPENMGEEINTKFDEDAPFIHPDGRIFYFSSKGHNTIGGYDIYNSLLTPERIFPAENVGFPVNTTQDDMFFTLSGSGKYAYFSSAFGNKYGNHDIFRVEMNLNIPLTIIKGTIKAGDPPKPVSARIRVVQGRTNKKMKYVYNPNPTTGRYLLILPPGTDYSMIIESNDFMTQNLQLQIPDQSEFFELFQAIRLKPIVSMGKQVGEQLMVSNTFEQKTDEEVEDKNYDELFGLIDKIIAQTDSIGNDVLETRGLDNVVFESPEKDEAIEEKKYDDLMSLLDEAFELGDTAMLNEVHDNTVVPDKYKQVFIYSENSESSKHKVVVGNDTIYTAPEVYAFDESVEQKVVKNDLMGINKTVVTKTKVKEKVVITRDDLVRSKPEDRETVLKYTVYFDVNAHEAPDSVGGDIADIAKLLVNNESLGFVVSGYADNAGDAESNKILSRKRIGWFLDVLYDYSVDTRRGIKASHGEEKASSDGVSSTDRRIDIEVFKLKKDDSYAY